MRLRLSLLLAVVAALVLPLASGGASSRPVENPRAWLGFWKTEAGPLVFQDVYQKRSECTACGNPRYWYMEGQWRRPNKGWTKIWGSVGAAKAKDHGAFQGEWKLSRSDPYNEFKEDGSALMYLSDDAKRITRGFWKACPLQAVPGSKCPHGHWRGKKEEGLCKAGFRFTQHGYPDGKHGIRTQTGGAGSLAFRSCYVTTNSQAIASHGSKVLHIDEIPGAADLHLDAELTHGRFTKLGTHRRLMMLLYATITRSDNPKCAPGSPAKVVLTEGFGGVPDQIRLFTRCHEDYWTSTNPNRVSVHLEQPRETP